MFSLPYLVNVSKFCTVLLTWFIESCREDYRPSAIKFAEYFMTDQDVAEVTTTLSFSDNIFMVSCHCKSCGWVQEWLEALSKASPS